jgi:hypothetical protein
LNSHVCERLLQRQIKVREAIAKAQIVIEYRDRSNGSGEEPIRCCEQLIDALRPQLANTTPTAVPEPAAVACEINALPTHHS